MGVLLSGVLTVESAETTEARPCQEVYTERYADPQCTILGATVDVTCDGATQTGQSPNPSYSRSWHGQCCGCGDECSPAPGSYITECPW
jgi:hypothetical protein